MKSVNISSLKMHTDTHINVSVVSGCPRTLNSIRRMSKTQGQKWGAGLPLEGGEYDRAYRQLVEP